MPSKRKANLAEYWVYEQHIEFKLDPTLAEVRAYTLRCNVRVID